MINLVYVFKNFSYKDVEKYGIDYCINETINYLKNKVDYIHISFDIDGLSPDNCPSTGKCEDGYRYFKTEQIRRALKNMGDPHD
mgnify:CR=1 FL=1